MGFSLSYQNDFKCSTHLFYPNLRLKIMSSLLKIVVTLSFVVINSQVLKASSLENIRELSLDCINRIDASKCNQALSKMESLQRLAARRKEYFCQTYILGLEADLLNYKSQESKQNSFLLMLEKVNQSCRDLDNIQ